MRKILTVLLMLVATLGLGAIPTSVSASSSGGDRVEPGAERVGTLAEIRRGVVSLTNSRRRAHGCANLGRNAALDRAAQAHSRKMADRNRMSHQLPGEPSLGVRVRRAGYNWTLVGENVAYWYPTPAEVVRAWMRSRSHRRNILNCRYQHIGIGYAVSNRDVPYWTQVFGRR